VRIDVLSLFPEFFHGPARASLMGKAVEREVLALAVHDLRQWATDRHGSVDGLPYGGGAGMVLKPEPFFEATESLFGELDARPRTVLLTPTGAPLQQHTVAELAAEPALLVLCGRYEGIDERVHTGLATDELSLGDYVLAGGEVAACVLIEAVTRLLPGVVGNEASVAEESFDAGLLEHPQYTRPAEYRAMRVPEVLRSGDHAAVAEWRRREAIARTRFRRPDLYHAWQQARSGADDPGPG
jgi:tRNA (guanine37-N1)-methyltransferase